jgi:carbamoyltransferase
MAVHLNSTKILGISAYYHDSAAALLEDGRIIAAAQEERFSRIKHDACFPAQAIRYCLEESGAHLQEINSIVFYDKPLIKFERLLETYLSYAPSGIRSFVNAMPVWLKDKLYLKSTLKKELAALAGCGVPDLPELLFTQHHQSHAGSAFFPSPFKSAAVLCLDGVGEWATTTTWSGRDNKLSPLWEIRFPHSLGLLYSAFTYFTGFRVNSGEYKLMGLAPYGEAKYVDLIKTHLIDIKADGSFRLNMDYFTYCTGLTMTDSKLEGLFGRPRRTPESVLDQDDMDIAASIQSITEEVVMKLCKTLQNETGEENLCLAGGVALNCVANGKVAREGPFKNIWIQPAAGDAGGALGAAYCVWHERLGSKRSVAAVDSMQGAYLGPGFSTDEVRVELERLGASYHEMSDERLFPFLASVLEQGAVVGWFQGRMEFGPRALGGRSILADPRNTSMQSVMNLKIKYRESFRPFAPSVLEHRLSDYFELDRPSPYMLLVAPVRDSIRCPSDVQEEEVRGLARLASHKSEIPAVTHVDYSARIHTVNEDTNPRYHGLIKAFEAKTGCAVLVNTSFNVRGEPMVCAPNDAYRCFMRTEMDYLVIENCLLSKNEQPHRGEDDSWMDQFEPD